MLFSGMLWHLPLITCRAWGQHMRRVHRRAIQRWVVSSVCCMFYHVLLDGFGGYVGGLLDIRPPPPFPPFPKIWLKTTKTQTLIGASKYIVQLLYCHCQQSHSDGHMSDAEESVEYGKVKTFSELAIRWQFELFRASYLASFSKQCKMVQQMICRLTHSCLPLDFILRWSLLFVFGVDMRCFQFHNLSPLIKCCYPLTVRLRVLDRSKSHFWDCVLCQLPEHIMDLFSKVCDFCFSLIQRPILLPGMCLVWFGVIMIIIVLQKCMYAQFYS